MSKLFEYTKLNLERTVQNLTAQDSEFIYTDSKTTVSENKKYSTYYLTDKRELYFTGLITSKTIRQLTRIKNITLYSQYTNIKGSRRETYPSNYVPQLKDDDYLAGSILRYFIQKANDKNSQIFEISESNFNKELTLYNKILFNWIISGVKEDVKLENLKIIINSEKQFKGIDKLLYPLQYWKPPKNSPEDIAKKMLFMKTN